jgi:hypothetical protein
VIRTQRDAQAAKTAQQVLAFGQPAAEQAVHIVFAVVTGARYGHGGLLNGTRVHVF